MAKDITSRADMRAIARKAARRIISAWDLTDGEAAALLDISPSAWAGLKAGEQIDDFSEGQMLRISALVGIYRALGEFFGGPLVTRWISLPNTGALFSGQRPIDLMIAGGLPALLAVRHHLEAL